MAERDAGGSIPAPNLRRIYLAKLAALGGIVVAVWILKPFISPTTLAAPITWAALLVAPPSLLVAWRSPGVPPWMLGLSFAVDIIAITTGVHFGGGADQVSGPLLYTAIIGLAGILISPTAAYTAAATSGISYSALIYFEYAGWLQHQVAYSRPPERQAATAVMVTLFLFLVAWLVSYAARQTRDIFVHAEEARRAAVSELSHDLKNPLTIIHGFAGMIVDSADAVHVEQAQRIRQAAQHALDLVHNVLDAAAIEGRPMQPTLKTVQVNELVASILELYGPAADAGGVRLVARLAASLPPLSADHDLLSRALANLISNAIKFSDHGGAVEVATSHDAVALRITVHDHGPGIPAAEQPHLFQPYARGTTSREVEGTGLGLYIARRVAEAHDGTVSVTSTSGAGCTFTLMLPLRPAP